jgi:hypothetical protein
VDDRRKVKLACDLKLAAKNLVLTFFWGEIIVIIKSYFPNGNRLLLLGTLMYALQIRIGNLGGMVRMNAQSDVYLLRVAVAHLKYLFEFLRARGRNDDRGYAGLCGTVDNLPNVVLKCLSVEVCMGIDKV